MNSSGKVLINDFCFSFSSMFKKNIQLYFLKSNDVAMTAYRKGLFYCFDLWCREKNSCTSLCLQRKMFVCHYFCVRKNVCSYQEWELKTILKRVHKVIFLLVFFFFESLWLRCSIYKRMLMRNDVKEL